MGRLDELAFSVPIDEVASDDGASHLRVAFSPPLGAGLKTVPIPRTSLEFLLLKRRLGELSASQHLARLALSAAQRATEGFPDCHTQLYLSDSELVTEHDEFSDDDLAFLGRVLEAVALGVYAEVGRQPLAPWKKAVRDGWSELVAELNARFDPEELSLALRRGEYAARVFVALDDDENWVTRVVVELDERTAERGRGLELERALDSEGMRVELVGSELRITRSGMVADPKYLSRLIDLAFEIAADQSRHSGPYRT